MHLHTRTARIKGDLEEREAVRLFTSARGCVSDSIARRARAAGAVRRTYRIASSAGVGLLLLRRLRYEHGLRSRRRSGSDWRSRWLSRLGQRHEAAWRGLLSRLLGRAQDIKLSKGCVVEWWAG